MYAYMKDLWNYSQFNYLMHFSKCAGLRLTDLRMASADDLILCDAHAEVTIKLAPLFPNQTLDIKNSVIEVEIFVYG